MSTLLQTLIKERDIKHCPAVVHFVIFARLRPRRLQESLVSAETWSRSGGIISRDALGLERVYVQAKRWAPGTCVGRPEIQGFYRALAGHRAVKGVFITTARFSTKAEDFANSVDRIVLIDGERLARLMTQYGVGVSTKSLSIPSVDSDYFEE